MLTRTVTLPSVKGGVVRTDYIRQSVILDFYFHIAYAILRHSNVYLWDCFAIASSIG
jgi:hypothetical protein